jgi:putative membrane protein
MKITLTPPNDRRLQGSVAALLLAAGISSLAAADTRTRNSETVVTRDGHDTRVVVARPLEKGDRHFMDKVAKASMSEVAVSRVAAARTTNPEVRNFAQMIIADHEKSHEELASLAAHRGVSLPAKDPHPDKWEKRNAKNFDREYLDQMVDDHEAMVKLLDKQAKDGGDGDTVDFARKHLPRVQAHLQHAIDLQRRLKQQR